MSGSLRAWPSVEPSRRRMYQSVSRGESGFGVCRYIKNVPSGPVTRCGSSTLTSLGPASAVQRDASLIAVWLVSSGWTYWRSAIFLSGSTQATTKSPGPRWTIEGCGPPPSRLRLSVSSVSRPSVVVWVIPSGAPCTKTPPR